MLSLLRQTLNRWVRPHVSSRRNRQACPSLERLQDRITPAVALQNGQIVIQGTDGTDVAVIAATSSQVTVNLNGQRFNFNPSAVGSIRFTGGLGDDRCTNNTNLRLVAFGDAGNDTLSGGSGKDMLDGGDGNDSLLGYGGKDTMLGRAGNDAMIGGAGNDQMDGGDGDDWMDGRDGNNALFGRNGNDTLVGGNGNDFLDGGDGNDSMLGYGGNDAMFGRAGNDAMIGGGGNDQMDGGDGDDWMDGRDGNDTLFGRNGNDILIGSNGNDYLDGGAGDDIMEGGGGQDRLIGGGGTDYSDRASDDPGEAGVETHRLRATLTGLAGATAVATFTATASEGTPNFEVTASGLPAGTMFVMFDTLPLGGFSVGASGTGQLRLTLPTLNVVFGASIRIRNSSGVELLRGNFGVNG